MHELLIDACAVNDTGIIDISRLVVCINLAYIYTVPPYRYTIRPQIYCIGAVIKAAVVQRVVGPSSDRVSGCDC